MSLLLDRWKKMSHLQPLRRLSKTMDLEIKCLIRTPFWSLLSLSSEVNIEAVVFILGYIKECDWVQ